MPALDPMQTMTPREVAEYLRMDEPTIQDLIASGEIPSFAVAGKLRVQAGALVGWLQGEVQSRNLEQARRALQDKSTWAAALREHPGLSRALTEREYPEALSERSLGTPPRRQETCLVRNWRRRRQARALPAETATPHQD